MADATSTGIPKCLFHNFFGANIFPRNSDDETIELGKNGGNELAIAEEVELSLGLSLNGRFGVEPEKSGKLERSASISNLVLSCEKNRAIEIPSGGDDYSDSVLPRAASLPMESELEAEEWRKRKELASLRRMELKRKRLEKLNNGKDKLTGTCKIQAAKSTGVPVLNGGPSTGRWTKQDPAAVEQAKAAVKTFMQRMPSVWTNAPTGRRIDGFLYKYNKEEEVSIVCVCHGSFLSPAEFVKHGGGGDVENPLRHIVISSAAIE